MVQRLIPGVASLLGLQPSETNTSPKKPLKEQKIDILPGVRIKIIPPKIADSKEQPPLKIFTLGCADGAVKATARVAELMERVASGEHFDLIFILGDNFDGKVKSRFSPTFLTHFHHIFAKCPNLKSIPKIAIPGNHDVIDEYNNLNQDMLSAQVLHTYTKLKSNPVTEELEYVLDSESGEPAYDLDKIKLFTPAPDRLNEIEIHYEDMLKFENQWYMFSSFFSVNWGDTEIICANTSTLASEYVAYYIDGTQNPFNQAAWLFSYIPSLSASTVIFAGHHPIVMTNDKRVICSDHPDYINKMEYKKLSDKKLAAFRDDTITPSNNHTDILGNIVFHPGDESGNLPQGFGNKVSVFLAAHHHAMHLYKKDKRIQIVSGGMGGESRNDPPNMQNRFSFADSEALLTFLKNNGTVSLSIPMGKNPDIIVDLYAISDPAIQLNEIGNIHLKYSLSSSRFIRMTGDTPLEKLRDLIIQTCSRYQDYLSKNPLIKPWQIPTLFFIPERFQGKVYDSVYDDYIFVDALKNYCQSAELVTYDHLILYLKSVLASLTRFPEWHAYFNEMLKTNYDISYDDFVNSLVKTLEKPAAISETSVVTPSPAAASLPAPSSNTTELPSKPRSLLTEQLMKRTENKKSPDQLSLDTKLLNKKPLPRRKSEESLTLPQRNTEGSKNHPRRNSLFGSVISPILSVGAPSKKSLHLADISPNRSNAIPIPERKRALTPLSLTAMPALHSLDSPPVVHTLPEQPVRQAHAKRIPAVISFSCPTLVPIMALSCSDPTPSTVGFFPSPSLQKPVQESYFAGHQLVN